MSKHRILLLTFLMGLALVGLISIQVYWILHDLEMKKQKFGQQVLESMNDAVKKLEVHEAVNVILTQSNVFGDSVTEFFKTPLPPEPPILKNDVDDVDSVFEISENEDSSNVDFGRKEEKREIRIIRKGEKRSHEIAITVRENKIDSLLKEQAILNQKIEKLNMQLTNVRGDQREKIMLKMENLSELLQKMTFEFDSRSNNVLQRINPNLIDSLVSDQLKARNILLPYAISILDGKKNSIPWKRSNIVDQKRNLVSFKINLFPGDIVPRKDQLVLDFANTFSYFLSSIWLMLFSSAIFTIIVISVFTYTIIVIVRQKRLSEIKNDFINNMTHEFKTPIASIQLAMDAINNPSVINDPEKIQYYSQIVRDENNRMYSHVENILQMAQFDKNEFKPILTQVDIHEVMSEAIAKMRIQAESRGGTIIYEPSATDAIVNADARFVPVVLFNLLDNALKYGGPTPEIKAGTRDVTGGILIYVEDNGIGMSKETQGKIFDKFFRVTSGNIHNVKGFGLGLSYVKAIVLSHGGNVQVSSSPGNGSRFEVIIPRNSKN